VAGNIVYEQFDFDIGLLKFLQMT